MRLELHRLAVVSEEVLSPPLSMEKIMDVKLDFKDISLVPRVVSSISSRSQVDTSMSIGNRQLKLPLIASPMRDVCDGKSGSKIIELGCFGIIHRFSSVEDQVLSYQLQPKLAAAVGVNGDYIQRFEALSAAGCDMFCIDIANGASALIEKTINEFLAINKKASFIVGNVASSKTFAWAAKLPNVVGVRVGVAGGNACTTKNATGIYHPMASLIMDCQEQRSDISSKSLIIADGGVREPSDFCKALALGADCVMVGSVFAAATDSPAELIKRDGRFYKMYHGSASFEIQKSYKEKPKYIEGRSVLLDFNNESLEQIVERFSDGLISSMSYFNAKKLHEYRSNISWVRI